MKRTTTNIEHRTARNTIARINRLLARDGERLRTTRGTNHAFGAYWIENVSGYGPAVVATNVDPTKLLSELRA